MNPVLKLQFWTAEECDIIVSKFEFQFCYYVHFRTNTLVLYTRKEEAITLIYKNIHLSYLLWNLEKLVKREREREREGRNCLDLHHVAIIYLEPCFFHGRLIQNRFSTRGCQYPSKHPKLHESTDSWLTALSADWLLTLGVKNFHCYISFRRSCILSMQFTWYFHSLLFTLKHSCTSCFESPN